MLTSAEIASLAGNGYFQTAAQVASVIKANEVVAEALDGSAKARKRNQLAQDIINNARVRVEAFAWACAVDANVQNGLSFDADGVPVVADAVLLTAAGDAWDKISGVVSGDEVVPVS